MSATFTTVMGVGGRATLRDSLDSLRRNMGPDDQSIVVVDSHEQGPREDVYELVSSYGPQFECYAYDAGYHWLGVEQMNYAFREVPMRGTHVLTLADDDVFVDGAFGVYRSFLERDPARPLLPRFVCPFGIDFSNGGIDPGGRCVLWDVPRMAPVRITSSIVVPRRSLQMWPTTLDPCVDYYWMENILKASPPPVWLDYVSIIARPDRRGDDVVHRGVWQCAAHKNWGYVEDQCCCESATTAAREVGAQ